MATNSTLKEHFPLYSQQGGDSSMINKQKIRQFVLQHAPLTPIQITESIQQHLLFLKSGGAGGYWKTVHIKGIVTALYFSKEKTDGKQASFEHRPFLENTNLYGVVLPFSNFCSSIIKKVNFKKANLSYSILTDVDGRNANFYNAQLAYTDFTRANLEGAIFHNANLFGADFENCILSGADFRGAILSNAKFPGAILTDIRI